VNSLDPLARDAVFALGILALFAIMLFVQVKVGKRAWIYHADTHELPGDELEEMRNALGEWLTDGRIVDAMVSTKTASREALQKTLLLIPMMSAQHSENYVKKELKRLQKKHRIKRSAQNFSPSIP